MGLQDREWYREAYSEKDKKYNGDFSLNSKPNEEYKESYRTKVEKKNVEKKEKNNSSNIKFPSFEDLPNRRLFLAKALKVRKQKGIYYVKCACGNCNSIIEVNMKKQPQGTYYYECPNCKNQNEFRKFYFSPFDIVVSIILLIIIYILFL